MSTQYSKRLANLANSFDLEQLDAKELANAQKAGKEGRNKLRRAIEKASRKGGFSNSPVARLVKTEHLHELIELAGAQFTLTMLSERGERVAEHQAIFKHFTDCFAALTELRSKSTKPKQVDPTVLINLRQWVFIGVNKMMDAAAMPRANDFYIKKSKAEMRGFDEGDVLKKRPSVQHIQYEIGRMILFQTRLAFVKKLWWKWFNKQMGRSVKRGSIGLRYFERDMDKAIAELIAYIRLKGAGPEAEEAINLLIKLNELPATSDSTALITLGSWVYGVIFDGIPIFEEVQPSIKEPKKLQFREGEGRSSHEGIGALAEAWSQVMQRANATAPMLAPPMELSSGKRGGRSGSAGDKTLHTHKGHIEMAPQRVDFFNNQALVPFKVNSWLLDLLRIYKDNDHTLGSFDVYFPTDPPRPSDLLMDKPADWQHMSEAEQLQWCKHHPEWRNVKRSVSKQIEASKIRVRDSIPSHAIFNIAEQLKDAEAFWIPTRPEFRTRLLADVIYLSYQGRDAAKALIKLARPVSIKGSEKVTRFWLANQLAATYGSNWDKLPFEQRINKVENPKFQAKVKQVALMLEEGQSWTEGAQVLEEVDAGDGKPAQFAAACREWYELFLAHNPKTETDLIVNNDCSCSGQQFSAGWRGSRLLASSVNCIPLDSPNDLYQDVYDEMKKRIDLDSTGNLSVRHARELKSKGFGRGICKGGIQPAMYGSGEGTSLEGVQAKMAKFAKKSIRLSEQEQALILKHFPDALEDVAELATLNEWFRRVAEACGARKGAKEVLIPTALGDTIHMEYQQLSAMRVDTFRYGGQQYKQKRNRITVVKPNGKPDKAKWKTALAANTTHGAGDATMLALALHDADFDFVTCHDSVGCAAPLMPELRDRMRRAYVQTVQFPLFEELLKANNIKPDQTWPDPVVGLWNPQEALQAEYLLS